MTDSLRVGVIGCGAVAQIMHLPNLHSLSEQFEITALSDLSVGRLNLLGEKYSVPECHRFTDYRRLLDADVDAVLVLNDGSHAPQTLDAIAAGKHVLVEKPLCLTVREANEIQAAVAAAGVTLMVAYMKRFDPGYLLGQRLVSAMEDPRYVQINTLHPNEDHYFRIHEVRHFDDVPPQIVDQNRRGLEELLDEAAGGITDALKHVYYDVFLGSMVHDTNALRALVGEPTQVLFAEVWPSESRTPSVTTVLEHPNALRTTYTWTYLADLRDYFEEIAVFSSEERVRIQFPSPFLKNSPTPVVVQKMEDNALVDKRVLVSYDEAFREELRAFHDCVVNDAKILTDVADARADLILLQQILAAFGPPGLGGEAGKRR